MRAPGIALCIGLLAALGCERAEPRERDLQSLMVLTQRYAEKLYLAGTAANWPLAAFYAHELEEVGEALRDGGFEVGGVELEAPASGTFLPAVRRVDAAIDAGQAEFSAAYAELVQACNACHVTTGHGFIRIVPPAGEGPYPAQDFTP